MVYLYLERGVGGAIFWDNKQYIGDRGRGGEFGHLCIVPNGKLCHCGQRIGEVVAILRPNGRGLLIASTQGGKKFLQRNAQVVTEA